jgi:hypothetical protein
VIRAAVLAGLSILCLASVGRAQVFIETRPLDEAESGANAGIEETRPRAEAGQGVVLRGLDKVSGATLDVDLASGGTARVFGLDVALSECRYPAGNPSGDAYAFLEIHEAARADAIFKGWMIASSPALSALDHPRYDIWVLRCITS